MTHQDYIAWAEEYRREADVLEKQIQQRRRKLPKKCYRDDKQFELLCDMKNDCLYAMKVLLKKAEDM